MFAPPIVCAVKARAVVALQPQLKDSTRGVVNRAVSALRRSQARWLALALSHDGLRVFANRILANGIFADRVLADWRRRHRGRLLARQIGGGGNAQHGEEPGRYDDGGLHDANPLMLGTRAGRPSDAPIVLCLCETPASTIPRSGSIAGRNGSRLFVALAMDWCKCDWEDRKDAD